MISIEKVTVAPAYQVVAHELQKLILSGAMKPGQPLPSETELAERFGVNRSTLREGIRRLESEGLVSRVGRRRLIVTVPQSVDLAPRLTRALVMQEVTFRELWQVANQLEPLAAELAATTISDADIAVLKANVAAMAAAIEVDESPAKLDKEFHSLLAEFTRNRVLWLSREPVGLLLYSTFETMRPQIEPAARRNLEAHRHIVTALEARDAIVAKEWMQKHMRDLMRGWLMGGYDMDTPIDPAMSA